MILRTLDEILNNPWGELSKDPIYPERTPLKWFPNQDLKLYNIKEWEEILYIEGVVGVYVSWDPYEEFYILTHNQHLSKKYIEIYQGNNGIDQLIDRCRQFGIELPEVKLTKS